MTRALNSIIAPIGIDTDTAPAPNAPEWIQLIPSGTFHGADGRGPYVLGSADDVIAASGGASLSTKLPIDVNHAIDLQGVAGANTPAQGWIVALEARDGSIWGKVEWTPMGRWAVSMREYGFISPVFLHTEKAPHQVLKLERAALTNNPNLTLKALHTREDNAMLEKLRKALGLPETATEAEILAAASAAHTAGAAHTALMAKLAPIAGAAAGASEDAVVTALQAAVTKPALPGDAAAQITALQGQVTALQSQLTGYVQVTSQERAATTIDKAITDGKVPPVMRDHYIARHVKNAEEVDKEIALLPSIHSGGLGGRQPPKGGVATGEPDADEKAVMAMMGVDPTAYAETRKTLVKAEG